MSLSVPLRVRVEKDVIVRVNRILKGKGEIFVSEGQEVSPSDIIGTSLVSPGFRTINLANLLSVPPNEVSKYLKRSLGQKIYKDELLAQRTTFLGRKKVVISPTDGILEFFNPKTGDLKLKFLPKKEDLPVAFYGIVEQVDKDKDKIVIKTQASILHGMFGTGKSREGILHIIGKRDELIIKALISPNYDGLILVGGSLLYKDAISAAISCGVSGIITGGINASDYRGMAGGKFIFPKKLDNDIGVSIVVCEGFGSIPIGEDIYEMLKSYNGKFVSMDGNRGVVMLPSFESKSMIKVRNTKLPVNDQSSQIHDLENQMFELKIGLRVRIIGNSFLGQEGKIVALDKTETLLPSGIKTYLATVETKTRKLQVPFANCEVIL